MAAVTAPTMTTTEADIALSPRVRRLKEIAVSFEDDLDPAERGIAVTRSYTETRGLPTVLRRAHATAHALAEQTVRIFPGELLVGRIMRQISVHAGIQEGHRGTHQLAWPELAGGHLNQVDDPPEGVEELYSYWREAWTPPGGRVNPLITEEERVAMRRGVYSAWGIDIGHRCPDYRKLVGEGLGSVRDRAQERLAELDETVAEQARQRPFLEAVVIVCQAAIDYAHRYAEEARRLASEEADGRRRAELLAIAERCEHVPEHPARTFPEALQSIWLFQCAQYMETSGSAHSFGRGDQYLFPLYGADIAAGRLTRDEGLELIECFHLKCYMTFDFQLMHIGGMKPDGSDGTNELSYLFLDGLEALGTPRDIAVRIHKGTPPEFLGRAAEVAKLGLGRPDFWSDEVTIPALERLGIATEDARDYAAIGCVELTIPGKCNPRTMCHGMNLAKCLELALNNGRDQLTGEHIGEETGQTFATYEELHAAYRSHARRFIRLAIAHDIRCFLAQPEAWPCPLGSALVEGCVESGRDMFDGGAVYNNAGVNLEGVADVANSLAAVKRLVFEEAALTLGELQEALRADFDEHEPLRQMLLRRAPKYGNDDAGVDRIAREEAAFYCDEVGRYRTPEGGRFAPLIFGTTSSSIYHFSPLTGASAGGRKAGEPLSLSVTPAQGTDVQGATASLNSVAKLDFTKVGGGASHIIDLHPTALRGEAGAEKLAMLLRSYFDAGGMNVGITVADEETLREAQAHPDRYRNLMVRVFGFSTQFVSLAPAIQDHVIAKTRHEQ